MKTKKQAEQEIKRLIWEQHVYLMKNEAGVEV